MNIGPLETVDIDKDGNRVLRADVTEQLSHFHSYSFELLDRLIAYNVFFNEAYDWATKWKSRRIWKPWETLSRLGVLSTPAPKSGPKKALPEYLDNDVPYSMTGTDNAQISKELGHVKLNKPGGITMNSRWMQLKVTGEDQYRVGNDDNSMTIPVIKGVVPKVSGIITVTPDMLKAMLGKGYLN